MTCLSLVEGKQNKTLFCLYCRSYPTGQNLMSQKTIQPIHTDLRFRVQDIKWGVHVVCSLWEGYVNPYMS